MDMYSKFRTSTNSTNNFACKPVASLALAVLLGACQVQPQYSTVNRDAFDAIQQNLETASQVAPASDSGRPSVDVLQALVPGLTLNSATLESVEERFDFAVQDAMDIREFFTLLTEGTDYSIVVHPAVNGSVSSLDLKNVTIPDVLEQISLMYGYVINRNGTIYQVTPGGLQTRIFKVDYLNVNRSGTSNMQVVAGGILSNGGNQGGSGFGAGMGYGVNPYAGGFGGGVTGNGLNGLSGNNSSQSGANKAGGASISTSTEANYWDDLQEIIASIINAAPPPQAEPESGGLLGALTRSSTNSAAQQRAVIVSPQTGMIVVRAYPDELEQVAQFLAQSQSALQRQVILEAKILEVELKEGFQSGIDLSFLDKLNTDNTLEAKLNFVGETLDGISSPTSIAYSSSDFSGVIKLLETQGNVQVISSPRISTLNNQKAVFKVGDEEYFLTNANTTSFGAGIEQTTNQSTSLQPFFSGIALDVTPQISEAGDIILHIHPLLNQVQEDIKIISGDEFPLANSTTRESDSIARARNGEVIVISGLMQTRARGSEAGLPGVRDIPVVGNAFEQRQRETVKTELVILLRAIVDEGDNMQSMIKEHSDSFESLRRQIDPYYR